LLVWTREIDAANRLVSSLEEDPVIRNVHPLRCDYNRIRGHLYTIDGAFDHALECLGRAAVESRGGLRMDKMLETMLPLALLAGRRGNWSVGLRYLRNAQTMIQTMRGKLACLPS